MATKRSPQLEGHPPARYYSDAIPGVSTLGPVDHGNISRVDLHRRSRRTQIEIIAAILSAAKEGATKTSLVYKSNLNFTLVARYTALLGKKGLLFVEVDPEGHNGGVYKTSEKGSEVLAKLREAISLTFEETATPHEIALSPSSANRW